MLHQRLKQKLIIDPYYSPPADQEYNSSSTSTSSSFSPALFDISSLMTTPSSGKPDYRLCFALCLYDYNSTDPDHLSFRENEILEIVKQEESGWWAALRDNRLGWVPSAFLQPISDNNAAALIRNIREDLRSSHSPGKSSNVNPASHRSRFFIAESPLSHSSYTNEDEWIPVIDSEQEHEDSPVQSIQLVSPTGLLARKDLSEREAPIVPGLTSLSLPSHESPEAETSDSESSPEIPDALWSSRACPPSPMTPMPHPQHRPSNSGSSLVQVKTGVTPITPASSSSSSSPNSRDSRSSSLLSRSTSESGLYGRAGLPIHHNLFGSRSLRRRPILFNDRSSLSNSSLSSASLSNSSSVYTTDTSPGGTSDRAEDSVSSPDLLSRPFELQEGRSPVLRRRPDKIRQLTGDDDAAAFHQAKKAQLSLPWYLRPMYGGDDIQLEYDSSVRAGTLHALVERLTVDPLKQSQEARFRHAFLTTFHSFTTADVVFDMLIERYRTDHPHGLTSEEFDEWKDKRLRPLQKRVLTVLTMWFEEHGLLRDDPQVVPRLREFLCLVISPDSLAAQAKEMLASLDRLASGIQSPTHSPTSSLTTPSKKRRHRFHKQDIFHADPAEIAQHLTLLEHRIYFKLRPQECIDWGKGDRGRNVPNLCAFCGTHDKLATWVKSSVLKQDSLGKRAATIEVWIKVAERCRAINNFSSMTAIVVALSSAMLTRLQLTWAHVTRSSHLEPMQKLTEPTGNFSAFRTLYKTLSTNTPCVPFIGMFLTDIVHIQDQLPDTLPRQSSQPDINSDSDNVNGEGLPLINFIKRRRWYSAVNDILRYQNKAYSFVEDTVMMGFIEQELSQMVDKEQASLWERSSELQHSEVAHADIRRGLEDAGF